MIHYLWLWVMGYSPGSEIARAVEIIITSCFSYKRRRARTLLATAKSPRRIVTYTSTAVCVLRVLGDRKQPAMSSNAESLPSELITAPRVYNMPSQRTHGLSKRYPLWLEEKKESCILILRIELPIPITWLGYLSWPCVSVPVTTLQVSYNFWVISCLFYLLCCQWFQVDTFTYVHFNICWHHLLCYSVT